MNLFNDRWLVLIGGETSIDPLEAGSLVKIKEDDAPAGRRLGLGAVW